MVDLIVIGSGEHARVIMEMADDLTERYRLIGYTCPERSIQTEAKLETIRGVKWLGDDSTIKNYPTAKLILGVGNRRVDTRRRTIVDAIDPDPSRWAVLVHYRAHVAETATLGAGSVVMAGAVVNSLATIGQHAIINSGAIIEHDATVGSFTHIAPGAMIGGCSVVGEDCFVGMGAVIRDHIQIARDTLVAMGAVVTKSCRKPGLELRGYPAEHPRD